VDTTSITLLNYVTKATYP